MNGLHFDNQYQSTIYRDQLECYHISTLNNGGVLWLLEK